MLVNWNLDPVAIHLNGAEIRWYAIAYVFGFLVAYYCFEHLMLREGKRLWVAHSALLVMLLATIIGGRLGHCFFYHADEYLREPWRILNIRDGGTASHGVLFAAMLGLAWWSWYNKLSYLWICDRLCVCIPFVAACVRLGNFANSEIVGIPTEGNWGVVFLRHDTLPRHPAVLYEAVGDFLIFALMLMIYYRTDEREKPGALWGWFMVTLFGARIVFDLFKDSPTQNVLGWPLTHGQLLSIPAVAIGILLLYKAQSNWQERITIPNRHHSSAGTR